MRPTRYGKIFSTPWLSDFILRRNELVATRGQTVIELFNVSKSYNRNKVRAVDNLTLTVKPGEIFGFLGPNGAGKTTTIKMIVGLLRPDSGRILVDGFDVDTDSLKSKADHNLCT